MSKQKKRELVSILMESPLYLTLPVQQRNAVIETLSEHYPQLQETRVKERAERRCTNGC